MSYPLTLSRRQLQLTNIYLRVCTHTQGCLCIRDIKNYTVPPVFQLYKSATLNQIFFLCSHKMNVKPLDRSSSE